MKNILNLALVLALSAGAANASINVLDSATGSNDTYQAASISFNFSDLDLTGGSKLVVSIGVQTTKTDNTGNRIFSSVTFDGQPMTEAARIGGDGATIFQRRVGIRPASARDTKLSLRRAPA